MVFAQETPMATNARSASTSDKKSAGHSDSGLHSPRPASSHTLNSTFADSAVDMEATTPIESVNQQTTKETDYFKSTSPPTSPEVDQTLSEKMRQLTARTRMSEQDETMTAEKQLRLKRMLVDLEAYLEEAPAKVNDGNTNESAANGEIDTLPQSKGSADGRTENAEREDEDDEWIDESELIHVRTELAATLQSMRERQEEQRHLHQLTIHKLEAVAQRCLAQEQQAEDLLCEVRELRLENHTLGRENDQLREKLACIEADAAHKEVAVHAMSSAVAGLEGWIESTHVSRPQTPVAEKKPKRQRVVIRGKGRFRGRYYVDEDGDHAVAYSLADAAAESQELHDGVKAWLRGFRDVEEELRQHESPTRSRPQGRFRRQDHRDEDEWGDFESPNSYK